MKAANSVLPTLEVTMEKSQRKITQVFCIVT